jgi:hypothetical protein
MGDPEHDADESQGPEIQFVIPPEHEAGVYANTFAVWHTAYDFTIDFAASQLPEQSDLSDPESPYVVPCRVVSRVRIPASTVFDLIRTINERMGVYEVEWGMIRPPQRPEEGEPDEE